MGTWVHTCAGAGQHAQARAGRIGPRSPPPTTPTHAHAHTHLRHRGRHANGYGVVVEGVEGGWPEGEVEGGGRGGAAVHLRYMRYGAVRCMSTNRGLGVEVPHRAGGGGWRTRRRRRCRKKVEEIQQPHPNKKRLRACVHTRACPHTPERSAHVHILYIRTSTRTLPPLPPPQQLLTLGVTKALPAAASRSTPSHTTRRSPVAWNISCGGGGSGGVRHFGTRALVWRLGKGVG